MNLPESSNYEQPPAGTHNAVCYAFIDLGTQPNEYNGETKMQHQVFIRWELVDELMTDGRPFTIGQFYTWSMADKAKLRQHLEAWRNKPFEKGDFGPGGFNTKKLLGVPCTLVVGLNEKGNARVSGVGPKMKGVDAKSPVNDPLYVALTAEDFEPSALAKLSDKMQENIKRSPEYKRLVNGADEDEGGPVEHFDRSIDDEIPF